MTAQDKGIALCRLMNVNLFIRRCVWLIDAVQAYKTLPCDKIQLLLNISIIEKVTSRDGKADHSGEAVKPVEEQEIVMCKDIFFEVVNK